MKDISKKSLKLVAKSDEFESYISRWLTACKSNALSDKSVDEYERVMGRFYWWYTEHTHNSDRLGLDPANITTNELRQFVAYLRENQPAGRWGQPSNEETEGFENRTKANLKPATVLYYANVVKVFFNWLEEEGVVKISPFNKSIKLTSKKNQTRVIKTVDTEALEKIFSTLDVPNRLRLYIPCRDFAIISFLIDTGVRRGELLSIRLEDLDQDKRRCRVRGKTGERYVFYSHATKKAIEEYMEYHRKDQSDANSAFELWLTSDGYPLSYGAFSGLIRRVEKHSGVRFHAHALRHTFATLMAQQGVNVFDLKEMLGHSSINTTQIYVNANPDMLAKAYQGKSPLSTLDIGKKRRGRPPRSN